MNQELYKLLVDLYLATQKDLKRLQDRENLLVQKLKELGISLECDSSYGF